MGPLFGDGRHRKNRWYDYPRKKVPTNEGDTLGGGREGEALKKAEGRPEDR